jgi:hypothetical protein
MLKIMIAVAMNAIITNVRESQTSTAATAPTWPTSFLCDMDETVLTIDAVATCCQRADTKSSSDASARKNVIALDTGFDGNGLMSMSEPVLASRSWCHRGNVANPTNDKLVKAIAPIL